MFVGRGPLTSCAGRANPRLDRRRSVWYNVGMTKRKQSYEQAMAAERNFAKGRHMQRKAAEARREAAAAQQATTPEQAAYEAKYDEARKAYNANPTADNFATLNDMRGRRP